MSGTKKSCTIGSTWCLDTTMMIMYRNISPVLSESTSDDTVNEEKWPEKFYV
ncbi:10193_t:CDS:2 [Diversispora eburnea]|uniref:10193_t:CDS:1 n=1 Tax=Diversispora eburnea TaxID=1213867 RepID=A0A9N8ZNV3_9GLOM|nr:10193_t:CDS:2 [Diversispora eburnea]